MRVTSKAGRDGWLAALISGLALAGCGGGEPAADPPVPQTFEQRAQALAARTPPASSQALTAEAQAEASRRSREWAVAAVAGTPLASASVMTSPPIYFAMAFVVDAAAQGATRDALRQHQAPADRSVQAALQRGLERRVSAAASAVFDPAFLDVVTASGQPDTWSQLTLQPLSAVDVAAEPELRLQISDALHGQWAWPSVEPFDGVHSLDDGRTIKVPMLRVRGAIATHTGSGFGAGSMALGSRHWLVRIVPENMADFGAAGLAAALADITPRLTTPGAAPATEGTWLLPVHQTTNTAGLDDRRGMALAMDEVNADLRGMGAGGHYLKAEPGVGHVGVAIGGFAFSASQTFEFVYSPRNRFGGSYGLISTHLPGNFREPCPVERADLRPYYLALVQVGGQVTMLARMAGYESRTCDSALAGVGAPAEPVGITAAPVDAGVAPVPVPVPVPGP